jgi:hypothetical protein
VLLSSSRNNGQLQPSSLQTVTIAFVTQLSKLLIHLPKVIVRSSRRSNGASRSKKGVPAREVAWSLLGTLSGVA